MASPVSRNTFGACFLYFLPRHYNGTTILGWCIIKQGNKHEKKAPYHREVIGHAICVQEKDIVWWFRCQMSVFSAGNLKYVVEILLYIILYIIRINSYSFLQQDVYRAPEKLTSVLTEPSTVPFCVLILGNNFTSSLYCRIFVVPQGKEKYFSPVRQ